MNKYSPTDGEQLRVLAVMGNSLYDLQTTIMMAFDEYGITSENLVNVDYSCYDIDHHYALIIYK